MGRVAVAESASIDSGRETLQAEPALDGIRVLLVDDDANSRDAIATVLAVCGAQVVAVGCGADALQALKNQTPDVLVSDMAMPGMDGRSLLRRIRQLGARRGSIPAIALTGYASPVDRMKALLAGYQIFLPKPFDPTELITLVARCFIPHRAPLDQVDSTSLPDLIERSTRRREGSVVPARECDARDPHRDSRNMIRPTHNA